MTRASSPVDNRIVAARARFDELVAAVASRRAAGDLNGAATLAQVAAALAWHSPTGLFASPRLESSLTAIGRELATGIAPASAARVPGREIRTVLHVVTTAYLVGGHTRLAWRWIERDDGRVHSVAVTRQGLDPVPQPLVAAVTNRGGSVIRIDRAARSLVGRARALAGVASAADVVILHTHPFDVVPSLALAGLDERSARPPTMLLNHADHLFWVGLGVTDVVLHLRASGARLSVDRRGLPAERSTILPLPLGEAPAAGDRLEARHRLGYGGPDVVALTIASGYKYGATGGRGLLSLLRQAVDQHADLRILAVGPGGRDDWRAAESATEGRIRAFRNQSDLGPFYGAADVYLDSYPFSSLTSMLEAGQRAIPLLAFSDAGADADVLAFDDPATDRLPVGSQTESAFIDALGRLVADPANRRELGRRIAEELGAVHEGEGWRRRLESAYAGLQERHVTPRPGEPEVVLDPARLPTELDRRLVALLDAQQSEAPTGVRGHLRFAPFDVRLEEWRRSRTSERPLSALVLLPEWVVMLARRAGMLRRSLGALRSRGRKTTTGAR